MGFGSLVSSSVASSSSSCTPSISTTHCRFLLLERHFRSSSQKPILSSFFPFSRRCLHVVNAAEGPLTCISDADIGIHEASGGEIPPPLPSPLLLAESVSAAVDMEAQRRMLEKMNRRRAARKTYLFAAVASTVGITFLTAGAIYYRFAWQTQGAEVPISEVFGTLSLAFGAAVGMEYWARWAHRALWHDSLWSMHESHHRPRDGPFELNDVFAIVNAVPAIALIAYGFFHKGLVPGLCFGAGLGITVFGIAYMFVHDGLVHRRFPVGPIADVPYFQRVAAAHQLHHADKFRGVPYGLFLGPKELEAEPGGAEELENIMQIRKKTLSPKDG